MPIQCFSSLGNPYTTWIWVGMPQIPHKILSCTFFLYENKAAAIDGTNPMGTGFFIASSTWPGNLTFYYGVTNQHVITGGFSCIRYNTPNGLNVVEFGPEDWEFYPGADIAIIPIGDELGTPVTSCIGPNLLLTDAAIAENEIGPGDDVFMVGCFANLDSTKKQTPAVRFGNISTPPVNVGEKGYTEDCYCIDMHSRTVFSGSPVFVYRIPGNYLNWVVDGPRLDLSPDKYFFGLLGIHCGQFPVKMKIEVAELDNGEPTSKTYGGTAYGASGMTFVMPASKIVEAMNLPKLRALRQESIDMQAKA